MLILTATISQTALIPFYGLKMFSFEIFFYYDSSVSCNEIQRKGLAETNNGEKVKYSRAFGRFE
jgi:hypothetical protein